MHNFLCVCATANDSVEGPGWGQEQHEENEPKHHSEWFKSSCPCCPVCPWLLLSSVPRIKILTEMKYQVSCLQEKKGGEINQVILVKL